MKDLTTKKYMHAAIRKILSQARVKNIESADIRELLEEMGLDPKGKVAIDYLVEELKWGDEFVTCDEQRLALKELKDEGIIIITGFIGGSIVDDAYIEGEFENRNKYSIVSSFEKLQNKRDELYREINGISSVEGQVQAPGIEEKVADKKPPTTKIPDVKLIPSPIRELITPTTRYEDILICFIDDRQVKITVHGKTISSDYEQMGFANNKKNTKPPTVHWEFLIILSQLEGELTWASVLAKDARKQHKRRLSKGLKSYFGIDEDPFEPWDKIKRSYKLRIKLLPYLESEMAESASRFQQRIIRLEDLSENDERSMKNNLDINTDEDDEIMRKFSK